MSAINMWGGRSWIHMETEPFLTFELFARINCIVLHILIWFCYILFNRFLNCFCREGKLQNLEKSAFQYRMTLQCKYSILRLL